MKMLLFAHASCTILLLLAVGIASIAGVAAGSTSGWDVAAAKRMEVAIFNNCWPAAAIGFKRIMDAISAHETQTRISVVGHHGDLWSLADALMRHPNFDSVMINLADHVDENGLLDQAKVDQIRSCRATPTRRHLVIINTTAPTNVVVALEHRIPSWQTIHRTLVPLLDPQSMIFTSRKGEQHLWPLSTMGSGDALLQHDTSFPTRVILVDAADAYPGKLTRASVGESVELREPVLRAWSERRHRQAGSRNKVDGEAVDFVYSRMGPQETIVFSDLSTEPDALHPRQQCINRLLPDVPPRQVPQLPQYDEYAVLPTGEPQVLPAASDARQPAITGQPNAIQTGQPAEPTLNPKEQERKPVGFFSETSDLQLHPSSKLVVALSLLGVGFALGWLARGSRVSPMIVEQSSGLRGYSEAGKQPPAPLGRAATSEHLPGTVDAPIPSSKPTTAFAGNPHEQAGGGRNARSMLPSPQMRPEPESVECRNEIHGRTMLGDEAPCIDSVVSDSEMEGNMKLPGSTTTGASTSYAVPSSRQPERGRGYATPVSIAGKAPGTARRGLTPERGAARSAGVDALHAGSFASDAAGASSVA